MAPLHAESLSDSFTSSSGVSTLSATESEDSDEGEQSYIEIKIQV